MIDFVSGLRIVIDANWSVHDCRNRKMGLAPFHSFGGEVATREENGARFIHKSFQFEKEKFSSGQFQFELRASEEFSFRDKLRD